MTSLTTERLLARPITEEDFPYLVTLYSDPQIAKTMGVRTPENLKQMLERHVSL